MNRNEEFEAQLRRDDLHTVQELLTNPEKESLRRFYEEHFDEIEALIVNCRSMRTVLEDLYALDPAMRPVLSSDHLFVYMVNTAIQNGVLTKNVLQTGA